MSRVKWSNVSKVLTTMELDDYQIVTAFSGKHYNGMVKGTPPPLFYCIMFCPKNPTYEKGLVDKNTGRSIADQLVRFYGEDHMEVISKAIDFIADLKSKKNDA